MQNGAWVGKHCHNPDTIRRIGTVELMNVGVNNVREHVAPDVRIHYVIRDGGHAVNVVPDYASGDYFEFLTAGRDRLMEQLLSL